MSELVNQGKCRILLRKVDLLTFRPSVGPLFVKVPTGDHVLFLLASLFLGPNWGSETIHGARKAQVHVFLGGVESKARINWGVGR